MNERPAAQRSTTGRSFVRWLGVGLLTALLIVAATVYFREPLARIAVSVIANRAGIPLRSVDVANVSTDGMRLQNIAIGAANGPSARTIEISWTARTLLSGRASRIVVREPVVAMTYADGRFTVDGIPPQDPPRGGGGAPFNRLDIASAALSFLTPWGPAKAAGDAGLVAGPEGLAPTRVDLASADLDIAGGKLSLGALVFEPNKPLDAVLKVDNVDVHALLALIDVEGLDGSGAISGDIPVHLDSDGVSVARSKLAAAGPGRISYIGDALPEDLPGLDGQAGEEISLVREALSDFHYTSLMFELERAATGDGSLMARIEGANPAVLDNHPFVLNINLEADFDTLAEILLDGYATAGQLLRNASVR